MTERMRAALAGDAGAYRLLLAEAAELLEGYFARRLVAGRRADVDDLVQETLLAIHQRRMTFDPTRPFTVWLHAIARYKLVDYFRRNRQRVTIPIEDADELLSVEHEAATSARLDVDRLLATVPERTRAVIRDVKLDGRSVAETAAARGMSEASVKVTVHRGVRSLAARMGRSNADRGDE
ncbi:sigma-70 family RNA polymerase sigma factor [Aureimonas leprariae]|uniref:Sigma-70 family RNA polymerase sigma factor n=1 Tax=Plantimonas leprariae TaxID=2615207 RepID=A0A7V7TVG8_9HYPH|nr:sigma-70 family RNA polymerase sigma factor [Aureimonas leprariae]KAB0677768.1 sigma-70 family RNA polymerase sigma factor [Aureimonas leprariae]